MTSPALLGIGEVRHTRLRPVLNRFVYPTYFLMLPMRSLRAEPDASLRRNRFGLISFFDRDHGDGRADSLDWLDELLAREGVADASGEVWLHCYPRVLGHTFKPVSFCYCHRADDSLAAIVVEVNNTFGERHCYLLDQPELAFGRELEAAKVFHVSPFCAVAGSYRFRFMRSVMHPVDDCDRIDVSMSLSDSPSSFLPRPACGEGAGGSGSHDGSVPADGTASLSPGTPSRTIARIDHHDADGVLIRTSVSGRLQPLSPKRLRAAFFGMPLMTFGVIARIHWQALKLGSRKVPFFRKPPPPGRFTTR